ncbi:MAG: acetolactate synthase small subunit [Lachnospiraceae bacterium]|nr:acetolactate synthase small subunit [Lachnospiraceae bacterium]
MIRVLQLIVDNTSGVLSRISGLFSRRGYNIESITAGITADPRYTRITIVTSGDEDILEQIEKQVGKLVDVRDIRVLETHDSVFRELVLIKVKVGDDKRQTLISICEVFRSSIIDITKDSMIIELTGDQSKINAFIEMLSDYEILEIARTGIAGLRRGSEGVIYLND